MQSHNKQLELDLTTGWLPPPGNIAFVRQHEPLGLGHAIWCARNFIGNEPFAVLLADELLLSPKPMLKTMKEIYEEKGGNFVAITEIDPSQTSSYGIIDPENSSGDIIKIKNMVEKPAIGQAPSNLAIIGRYILQPEIFDLLGNAKPSVGGEIQLTDSMTKLLDHNNFYGIKFQGQRFDCGKPMGFLEANIAYALESNPEEVGKILARWAAV